MTADSLSFVHHFVPASQASEKVPTLLLLHGTGGDEDSLLELGPALAPQANLLSPRGNVLETGMPRFFRRLAEGVFDQADLLDRTDELAEFVTQAAEVYGFDPHQVVAVGYSNGANIAESLLLRRPGLLNAAVLFRAMFAYEPDPLPDLKGTSVFFAAGRLDPLVPRENIERTVDLFKRTGADVRLTWYPRGHGLAYDEIQSAHLWLQQKHLSE